MMQRLPRILLAVALANLAAPAAAQKLIDAARKVPLRTGRVDPPLVLGFRDGTSTILVEVAGERATATVDGAPLPADRLVRWGEAWFVLDTHGGVAAHLSVEGGRGTVRTHSDRFRVTLGLVVNAPDPAKLLLYDLAPRSALEVVSLRTGGPAEQAGLQLGDVLVEIDGKKPVTRRAIREAIGRSEVGGAIAVAYLRAGRRLEGAITLQRDYAAYLESGPPKGPAIGGPIGETFDGPVGGGVLRGASGEVVLAPPARDDLEDRVAALDRRMARIEALLERLVAERREATAEHKGR